MFLKVWAPQPTILFSKYFNKDLVSSHFIELRHLELWKVGEHYSPHLTGSIGWVGNDKAHLL